QFNLDGSLDVYLQSAEPGNEAQRENWLPAPSAGFQLVMRLYGASEMALPGILEGGAGHWRPPTVEPCLASGRTIAGWPGAQQAPPLAAGAGRLRHRRPRALGPHVLNC